MRCWLAAVAISALLVLPVAGCGRGVGWNCDSCASRVSGGCGWQWQCGSNTLSVVCDAVDCVCLYNGAPVRRFAPSCGFYSSGDSCEQTGFTNEMCGWDIPDSG